MESSLEHPNVVVTEPMQQVKKLWNASERATIAKQEVVPKSEAMRSRMGFERTEHTAFTQPKEIGDVEVTQMRWELYVVFWNWGFGMRYCCLVYLFI